MNDQIVEELNLLLNNFWILKKEKESEFYQIRGKLKELREFANNKLGCDIICNSKLIKLEKLPILVESTFQIEEFDNPLDYVLFVALLIYLEDKGLQDQFILSNLTEFITNFLSTVEGSIKPDWLKYKDRKSMTDVMKFAVSLGLFKIIDGNGERYAEDGTAEVLYENLATSHYVMRQFKFDISDCVLPEDFLNQERLEMDAIDFKRFQTYRGLIFYPNVVLDEIDEDTAVYMKNMRVRISEDMEKYLESELILTQNMFALSVNNGNSKDLFPNYRKSISDIALLVLSYLESFHNQVVHDKLTLTRLEIEKLFLKIHEENKEYFSKEYREGKLENFIQEVLNYMESYRLISCDENHVTFYPISFLMQGKYQKKEEINEDVAYELFTLDLEE